MVYLTVIASLELAIVLCFVAALLLERKATAELLAHFEAMHQQERTRLVAAIQRPDLVQPVHAPKPPSQEDIEKRQRLARELASVGTVRHGKPNAGS